MFGGETVTIVNITESVTEDEWNIPLPDPEETVVGGCRFRPMAFTETIGLTDKPGQVWKLTAPPVAAVLAIKPDSQIKFGDDVYEIEGGARPFTDASGSLFKVTVLCRRQQASIA